jgi:transposase
MQSAPPVLPEEPPAGLTCGIDWATSDHVAVVVDSAGRQVSRLNIPHTAAGLHSLLGGSARWAWRRSRSNAATDRW